MSSRLAMPVLAMLALLAVACGGSDAPEPETPAAEPAAEPASAPAGPRVFFMQPRNGDTVTLPLQFVFASDMFEISAVPAGDLTEARPAVGHYHLGVDTDCLPAGTVIPKADPWIHFGMGNNDISFDEGGLTPGPHKFSVQAGDDLHRAIEGLCETIEITVE